MTSIKSVFGERAQENVILAPYTSARIGGPADWLVTVNSADELADTVSRLWEMNQQYVILGGGSNVLVSDRGVRGVVVLNRAKGVHFEEGNPPHVHVESGVVFSNLANRVAEKGLAGLEWAATVPGTIGGAVYGNAGAIGGDMAGNLLRAELLTERGREFWPVKKMNYGYRSSALKKASFRFVILSAELRLKHDVKEDVRSKISDFTAKRKASQPPGASMGSMFKNPEGDTAGRLIDAAGLKGVRVGNAEISALHGNFFINHGETRASEIRALIELAQKTVAEKFSIVLELEIELIGEWDV